MLNLVQMARMYQKRPSEVLNIDGEYEAYCFDEASLMYISYLEDGKKPKWLQKNANDMLKSGQF